MLWENLETDNSVYVCLNCSCNAWFILKCANSAGNLIADTIWDQQWFRHGDVALCIYSAFHAVLYGNVDAEVIFLRKLLIQYVQLRIMGVFIYSVISSYIKLASLVRDRFSTSLYKSISLKRREFYISSFKAGEFFSLVNERTESRWRDRFYLSVRR